AAREHELMAKAQKMLVGIPGIHVLGPAVDSGKGAIISFTVDDAAADDAAADDGAVDDGSAAPALPDESAF
ncbi:MAG: hypothetical protein AAF411_29060, partial [Myxococcota bacterium]